jgi:uncharacterized protein (DUF4415 family)
MGFTCSKISGGEGHANLGRESPRDRAVRIGRASTEGVLVRRGALYRPIKQPVTLRLDADVVTWFKEHTAGGRYQTEINRVLRQHVADTEKRCA